MKHQKVKVITMGQSKTSYVCIPKWWTKFYKPEVTGSMFFDSTDDRITITLNFIPKEVENEDKNSD